MAKAKTYRAVYDHDGAMWYVRMVGVRGCHSQGRTIAQARRHILECLTLFVDVPVKVVDVIRLPKAVMAELKEAKTAQEKTQAFLRDLRDRNRKIVKTLTGTVGLSLHDAGDLLGVSKQRAQQLLEGV